jgi:hypothetical protein
MKRFAVIVCLGVALPGAVASAADESAEARAARFYAAGLEAPLLELRKGAMLADTCAQRLRGACSKEQRALASKTQTLTLLDALTLFPQRPAEDPAAGITKSRELTRKIEEASAAMLAAANAYDRLSLARYGATLRVCPDGDATRFRESLDELIRVDHTGLLGLSGDELVAANASLAQEEAGIADALRREPAADCVAKRNVGEYLMQLLYPKLQPWRVAEPHDADSPTGFELGPPKKQKKVESEPPKREVARAVTGNFIAVVATELQLTVFPETAPRIKAIADAVGKAAAHQ